MRKSKPAPTKPSTPAAPSTPKPESKLLLPPVIDIDESQYGKKSVGGMVQRVLNPKLLAMVQNDFASLGVDWAKMKPRELLVHVISLMNSWDQTEDKGQNKSKSNRIELIQDTYGSVSAEPYCMSTVQTQTALVEALLKVKSNLPASEGCSDTFRQAKAAGLLILPPSSKDIRVTDIPIWVPVSVKHGHTGRVWANVKSGADFETLEGNTTRRDGKQGIGLCSRDRKGYSGKKLAGFIREDFFAV